MGARRDVVCRQCGRKFTLGEGGGYTFHLLHCDACGAEVTVGFHEIGEAHLQYLKGLREPYSFVTERKDREALESYQGQPICEAEYVAAVERVAGQCLCGGAYRFDAPARCPGCGATQLVDDPQGTVTHYQIGKREGPDAERIEEPHGRAP